VRYFGNGGGRDSYIIADFGGQIKNTAYNTTASPTPDYNNLTIY